MAPGVAMTVFRPEVSNVSMRRQKFLVERGSVLVSAETVSPAVEEVRFMGIVTAWTIVGRPGEDFGA